MLPWHEIVKGIRYIIILKYSAFDVIEILIIIYLWQSNKVLLLSWRDTCHQSDTQVYGAISSSQSFIKTQSPEPRLVTSPVSSIAQTN